MQLQLWISNLIGHWAIGVLSAMPQHAASFDLFIYLFFSYLYFFFLQSSVVGGHIYGLR